MLLLYMAKRVPLYIDRFLLIPSRSVADLRITVRKNLVMSEK